MAQILVRDLDPKTVTRLKDQAKRNRRSLQGEVKLLIEQGVKYTPQEFLKIAREWQRRLRGRKVTDSADLVREDRER